MRRTLCWSRRSAFHLRSFCGRADKAAPWQERNTATAISAAMTNHAVLAGSVLAGVALWATVYTSLLPKQAPARSAPSEMSVARSVVGAPPEQGTPSPGRWVDLPREEPRPSVLPATAEDPSAIDLTDAGQPRTVYRVSRHRLRQIRRGALPDALVERRFVRERVSSLRRGRARMRFRRTQEPIQFSLATRSSS